MERSLSSALAGWINCLDGAVQSVALSEWNGQILDDKKTVNENRELRLSHGRGQTTRHTKPSVFLWVCKRDSHVRTTEQRNKQELPAIK